MKATSTRHRTFLQVEQLECRTLLSGTPQMLADINPGATPSNPSLLAVIDTTTYFAADDGTHGNELWKTDGTTTGTSMVADINPGSGNSNPGMVTNFNGKLYFTANDGTHGGELWTSDGTPGGTTRVTDINPGSAGSYPGDLTIFNGKLYFSANDGTNGVELWTSDGTAAGTTMVADINPGTSITVNYYGAYGSFSQTFYTEGSYPWNLTNVNGKLYFTANDGTNGVELWTSDGTAAGTTMVKDINPGSTTFTSIAWWGYFGNEYESVTVPSSSYPSNLTNVNGTLYFTASDGAGTELWTSDGSPAGTTSLTGNVSPFDLTDVNGTLYFIGGNGSQLWSSNGTAATTVPIASFASANDLTNVNGELYFAASDGTHGMELWQSNGTAGGTTMVKDINPGSSQIFYYSGDYGTYSRSFDIEGSYPGNLTNVNGRLYFTANNGTDGAELWTSNGTAGGTTMVQDIYTGSTSYTSYSGWYGIEYRTWSVPNSSFPRYLTNLNGTLLFTANDGTHGIELWAVPSGPSLSVSAGTATPTAGQPDTFTITALNADGTPDTSLNGAVNLTSSDPNAILPGSVMLTNGTGQFSATLETAGAQWIRATVAQTPSDNGSDTVVVQPGAAVSFTLTGYPSPVTVGTAGSFTVTAFDTYHNVATGYTGTVHFTSNDLAADLPADANLTNGVGQFSATLKTLGTNLSVTATDTNDANLHATQSGITVIPFASVSGPSAGAINQTLSFTLGAGDDPAGTVFTVSWGDGSSSQATTGTSIAHTYTTSATYTVSVTASAAGLTSNPATQSVRILPVSVTVASDPAVAGKQMLVIDGTASSDSITLGNGANNGVTLSFNGIALGTILPTNSNPFALVQVFGEGGYDVLDASNLSISSVLVGGSGNDTLYGGSGRNLLIGDAGSDTLFAGSAGDILIGGTTKYDANNAANQLALASIMAEWNSTASYATRVKQLSGKAGSGGPNGSYFLNSTTVSNDNNATDILYGGAGMDWYIVHQKGKAKDKIIGQTSGETVTQS